MKKGSGMSMSPSTLVLLGVLLFLVGVFVAFMGYRNGLIMNMGAGGVSAVLGLGLILGTLRMKSSRQATGVAGKGVAATMAQKPAGQPDVISKAGLTGDLSASVAPTMLQDRPKPESAPRGSVVGPRPTSGEIVSTGGYLPEGQVAPRPRIEERASQREVPPTLPIVQAPAASIVTPAPAMQPPPQTMTPPAQPSAQEEPVMRAWSDVQEARRRARAELEAAMAAREIAMRIQRQTEEALEHSELLRKETAQAREEARRALQEALRIAAETRAHWSELMHYLDQARAMEEQARATFRIVTETLRQAQALREEAEETRQEAIRLLKRAETVRQGTVQMMDAGDSIQPSRRPWADVDVPGASEVRQEPRENAQRAEWAEPEPTRPHAPTPEQPIQMTPPPRQETPRPATPPSLEESAPLRTAPRPQQPVPGPEERSRASSPPEPGLDKLGAELERLFRVFGEPDSPAREGSSRNPARSVTPPADISQATNVPLRPDAQRERLAPGEKAPDVASVQSQRPPAPRVVQPAPAGPAQPAQHKVYSGILRLLFMPYPDADSLQRIWNALEKLVGAGQVLSSSPTRDGSGLEMVLDLTGKQLNTQELLSSLPDSELRETQKDLVAIVLRERL